MAGARFPLMRFPGFKAKALTFSYDDGPVWDRKLIELMSKYSVKGTFNLNSHRFNFAQDNFDDIVKDQRELYLGSGNEVAIHTMGHFNLPQMDRGFAVRSIIRDRELLEEMFGVIIKGMAYPYGTYSDEVVEMCRLCGVDYSRTTVSTGNFRMPSDWLRLPATCHHNDKRLPELAEQFINTPSLESTWRQGPSMFYVWGHSYEFNNDNNWDMMEDFLRKVSGRDDVWYATNGEIFSYTKAFNSLIYSANGELCYNPTVTDVYFSYYGKDVVVPSGKTVNLEE